MLSKDATALPLLKAVRARLADEARWIKGELARDINGEEVWPWRIEAVSWSLLGAIRCELNFIRVEDRPTQAAIARELGFTCLADADAWADAPDRTHADIIARLDEAIEREGK